MYTQLWVITIMDEMSTNTSDLWDCRLPNDLALHISIGHNDLYTTVLINGLFVQFFFVVNTNDLCTWLNNVAQMTSTYSIAPLTPTCSVTSMIGMYNSMAPMTSSSPLHIKYYQ